MNTKIVAIMSAVAWAGLTVSFATPVDALVRTSDSRTGSHAVVTNQIGYIQPQSACSHVFQYTQQMRFLGGSCSLGYCNTPNTVPQVESAYSTGRKTTQWQDGCGTNVIYSLGSCSC
jgi:hypothetical protein